MKRIFFIVLTTLFIIPGTVTAQNVHPVSIGGQEKIYVDTNGTDGVQEDSDSYMTISRVQIENGGDDSGKYAFVLESHGDLANEGGFQQVFVMDGDVNGDGSMHIHEASEDITYLDDDNKEVTVKTRWAHIGETGGPSSHRGYMHSVVFEMSDSENPVSGYNKITVKAEHGTTKGEDISESTITIGYNDEDYADTIGFDNGGIQGNVLTNIGQNFKTAYVEENGQKTAITQELQINSQSFKVHIPLDSDGACNMTDGQADGFFLNSGMKPLRDDNPTPSQLPGTTGSLQVNILPENATASGAPMAGGCQRLAGDRRCCTRSGTGRTYGQI